MLIIPFYPLIYLLITIIKILLLLIKNLLILLLYYYCYDFFSFPFLFIYNSLFCKEWIFDYNCMFPLNYI